MANKYTNNETKNILLNSLKVDLEKPSVLIPSKLKSAVKLIDKQTLKEIHKDSKTAREFILYFCSFIYPKTNDVQEDTKGCPLSSKLLAKLLAPAPYLKIVEACLKGTPLKGPFVKRENYRAGHHSYLYSIAPCYEKSFLMKHTFKSETVKKAFVRNILNQFKSRLDNPIITNLLAVYSNLELPEPLVVLNGGIKKSKEPDYRTNKGKKLHHLNKNPKSRFKHRADFDLAAFVEDHLKLYKKLTIPHLRIPSIQSKYAGGRVTDSITLMPSWIRGLFKINGEFLTECDFTALHPNIIMSLYGGRKQYLDHKELAKEMGEMKNLQEPEKLANLPLFKTQHLAFFNSWEELMKDAHPDLWTYYTAKEPEMMAVLLSEKKERGYKHTSLRMFTKEVEIMTEAIRRLNEEGIYVLYVYDALLCQQSHKETVVRVMNEVAEAHEVFARTKAKNLASEPLPTVLTAEMHSGPLKCPGNANKKLPENPHPKDHGLITAA
jgi:hypothetical protein